MTAGRPKRDYVGQRFGLVIVVRREGRTLWCRCDCGAERQIHANNAVKHPPKSHNKCKREYQYRLPLDTPVVRAYNNAS